MDRSFPFNIVPKCKHIFQLIACGDDRRGERVGEKLPQTIIKTTIELAINFYQLYIAATAAADKASNESTANKKNLLCCVGNMDRI